jgi:hypothetical protein
MLVVPVVFREQKNPREAEACGEILPKEGGGDIGQTTHAVRIAATRPVAALKILGMGLENEAETGVAIALYCW